MKSEITRRQDAVQSLMSSEGISGLILATPQNIQYFTGVTEPSTLTCGKVIFGQQIQPILAVLWLDQEATQQQTIETSVKVYSQTTQGKVVVRALEQLGGLQGTIGMDSHAMQVLKGSVYGILPPDVEIIDISNAVEGVRSVKSEEEIQCIKKACEIADEGMKAAEEVLKSGVTELQVAALVEHRMMMLGSDRLRHTTGVASGSRSRLPHAFASQKQIEAGDTVVIDFGAVYQGYCSDIARTFVVGKPDKELKAAFDVFRQAQEAVLQRLRPGVAIQEILAVAREFTKADGYQMVGYMGHNIGLQVEEHPYLMGAATPDPNAIIRENNVVAFFQGSIKREGVLNLGLRLEDTVLVTESGAKMLTTYPRELIVK